MENNERPTSAGINEVFGQADTSQNNNQNGERTEKNKHYPYQKKKFGKKFDRHKNNYQNNNQNENVESDISAQSEELTDNVDYEVVESADYTDSSYTEATEVTLTTSGDTTYEIVGIRFKNTGKTYYFAPGEIQLKKGDCAVVETARGLEFGFVSVGNSQVPASEIVPPLRNVIRKATEEDAVKYEEILAKEKEAFGICLEKIRTHELEMKLIDAEYTFDMSKLTFYFSANGRVDFRELVKDLASVFRTRIELHQIGIRDEAKLVGGLGVCGRPFCCTTFLSDFVQVSIKMAKEQSLSLNSAKISGACGRLMCCLRYEHDTYEEEIKKTPSVGSKVKTADGIGIVTEMYPLRGRIKVKMGDDQNPTFTEYDRDDVTVLQRGRVERNDKNDKDDMLEDEI